MDVLAMRTGPRCASAGVAYWAARSLHREFELAIMIERGTEEMHGSD
jgi:hypothetical protein